MFFSRIFDVNRNRVAAFRPGQLLLCMHFLAGGPPVRKSAAAAFSPHNRQNKINSKFTSFVKLKFISIFLPLVKLSQKKLEKSTAISVKFLRAKLYKTTVLSGQTEAAAPTQALTKARRHDKIQNKKKAL